LPALEAQTLLHHKGSTPWRVQVPLGMQCVDARAGFLQFTTQASSHASENSLGLPTRQAVCADRIEGTISWCL
jgi:hypothetical protein